MKYVLIINEPWNFQTTAGKNELKGKVIRKIDESHLIFSADEAVTLKNTSSKTLLLSMRYDECFAEEPYVGTVNIGLLQSTSDLDGTVDILKSQAVYAMIGSLKRRLW